MRYEIVRCCLRDLRRRRGWTQRDLAGRINISASHISNFETMKRIMSYPLAMLISETIECHPRELYEMRLVKNVRQSQHD